MVSSRERRADYLQLSWEKISNSYSVVAGNKSEIQNQNEISCLFFVSETEEGRVRQVTTVNEYCICIVALELLNISTKVLIQSKRQL